MYIIIKERENNNNKQRKGEKNVRSYFGNWSGCDEEPEKVFETLEEARKYVEEEDQYLSCEEYYIIEKDGKEIW